MKQIQRESSFHHVRLLLLAMIGFFTFFSSTAQDTKKITGTVINSTTSLPVSGASVMVKGGTNGISTGDAGEFSIVVPASAKTLVISSVGFDKQEVAIGSTSAIVVKMITSGIDLGDVVVVGYGARKKATLTGAIVQVGEAVFKDRPLSNVASALQGQIPGLLITRTSSRPGNEGLSMTIRGASSTSNIDPLIIVDGVPLIGTWEFNQLNPSDIESVTALKDGSAAIYGSRGQGGVILVSTKRGKGSKMQVSYNSNFRLNTAGLKVPWASMSQWAALYLQTSTSDKRDAVTGNPIEWFPQWTKETLGKMAADSSFDFTDPSGIVHHYANNNWEDALYGDTWSNQQDLSIRGATDKTAYMLSIGYGDNKGMLKTAYDGEKKYNIRFNYDYNISRKVKLETGFSFDNRTVQNPRNGVGSGFFDAPVFPTYNKLGQYYDDYGYRNPVAFTQAGGTSKNKEGILRLNSKLTADIFNGLKLTGTAAITKRDGWLTAYNQTFNLYSWLGDKINSTQYGPPNNPNITETVGNTFYQVYGAQLDYVKTIARDHNISVMVGNTAELFNTKSLSANRSQLQYTGLYDINTAISPTTASATSANSGGASHSGFLSYLSRVNYDYKKKYLLEVLGRRDGTSKFSEINRWDNFYSVSAGWRISQESFLRKSGFVNELKLRAAYGETGGQAQVSDYDYLSLMGTGTALFGSTPALQNTGFVNGISTSQKSWERMVNKNVGIDFSVLNNRLSGSFDVFEKRNVGMLIRLVYPTLLGGSAPLTNSGTLKTNGWELNLNWRGTAGKVAYTAGVNIGDAKNKIISYAGANTWAAGKYTTPREGYPLNSLYVYQTAGYFQSQKEASDYFATYGASGNAAGYNGATNSFRPGDLKIVDLDGDGKITASGTGKPGSGDAYFYGNADPHYSFGVNLGAQWKGFDFGAFVQGVARWNILRGGNGRAPFFRNYLNVNTTYIGKTWTPDNQQAELPRLSFDAGINNWNYQFNDVNVQNLSYARLKSLVIGYTLPKEISSKIKSDRVRIYFSGNDIFEITSVKDGFDPERGESSDNSYPFMRTWSFGLNVGF